MLAIKKLAATHDMDGPKFRPDPMAGTAVETDVWSMYEIIWASAIAGKTIISFL